jgi:hypothetical protein
VPPGDRAAGLGDDGRSGGEDRGDRREMLGKAACSRHDHPAAHSEHVAAGVGRDGPEVGRVVDQRRKKSVVLTSATPGATRTPASSKGANPTSSAGSMEPG